MVACADYDSSPLPCA